MFHRPLVTAVAVVGLCMAASVLAPDRARANGACGTGYMEKFDRKGEPVCIAESKERTRLLREAQMLRAKKREWRAQLIRDRKARFERQAKIEQRRRDRALN